MIKAAFFDIDGTLVSFNDREIKDSTLSSLDKARERGVRLFISSGRAKSFIFNVKGYPFDGYICNNGAYVEVGDEVLLNTPIPRETAIRIAQICKEHHIPCMTFGASVAGLSEINDYVRELQSLIHVDTLPVVDLCKMAREEDLYQLSPFMTEDKQGLFDEISHIVWQRWHPHFMDGNLDTATKSMGMAAVMKSLGLKKEEVIAFGDGGNDICMIRSAGIGVAMGNADQAVRSSADFVTLSADEDGVSFALRNFGVI